MKEKLKDNLKYIITILIIIIILCAFFIYYYKISVKKEIVVKENKEILSKKELKNENKEKDLYYFVDIKGAVNKEGVYKLKENSRIIDVINEAGGLKENADTSIINLSKKIFDEMFIVIYTKEEIDKYKSETISTKKINDKLDKNILIIDENNDGNIKKNNFKSIKNEEKESKKDQQEESILININTATKEELLTITGIGESKAESIISYREENGEFKEIEDIKNVTGIGDSLFEKIKEFITV